MSIAFLPRYSELGASSRCRFYMYFNEWKKAEPQANIAIYNGFSDDYLRKLYSQGKVGRLTQVREFLHMLRRGFILPENLIIEYELVPGLPYKYEKMLLGKRKYILNFDDNVWMKYANSPALCDKYDMLCRNAAGVIVANEYLYNKAAALNKNVYLIPTVVDLAEYNAACAEKYECFTAAWIGTPVTYKYLEEFQSVLQKVFSTPDRRLLVIADKSLGSQRPLKGVNAEYVSWSAERECEYLKRCHVGIMPLTDDEFSRGKSAYKLLQCQAAGLPLAASPVGENKNVVIPGKNGFLANSAEDWLNALDSLQHDKELYDLYSKNATLMAYEYSLQKYFTVYKDIVNKIFF